MFSDSLKIALVTPLFKAADQNNVGSYRLIFFLPHFSKILERVMYNRLRKYLIEEKYFIKTIQFPGWTQIMQIVKLVDEIHD